MARSIVSSIGILSAYLTLQGASAFTQVSHTSRTRTQTKLHASSSNQLGNVATTLLSISLLTTPLIITPPSAYAADDAGASTAANTKIRTGGASTLQAGRTIAITRGVNLDNSDFKGQNLKGVAFQQSIVRDTDFRGTNLVGASFFDATLDGSDFEGAGKKIHLLVCIYKYFIYCKEHMIYCNTKTAGSSLDALQICHYVM